MKTAVITPPSYLELVGRQSGYHMALSQWLRRNPMYMSWYKKAHAQGDFIMVDNGAAEPESERIDWTQVMWVSNQVQADEVVLPDVLKDSRGTVYYTSRAAAQVPAKNRCIVPQGGTWGEWLDCYTQLHDNLSGRYATIGIAKHLERLEGGRAEALRMLPGYAKFHYNIHLFGIWQAPKDEIYACRREWPYIRGIDSGAPIAYAQNSRWIGEAAHFSLHELDKPDIRFLNLNIDTMIGWCNDGLDG